MAEEEGIMKLWLLLSLIVSVFVSVSPAAAQSSHQAVRDIYKAQCSAVGGSVNGFCMCTEQLNLLSLAGTAVEIAVTTKKLDKSISGIINPFVQSCSEKPIDQKAAQERLVKMHQISLSYVQNNEHLFEEIVTLDEAGLLDPNSFSMYLSNGKFRDKIKAKLATFRKRQDLLLKTGAARTLLTVSKEKTKASAIKLVQELTDIDIAQAKSLSTAVKNAVIQCVNNAGEKSIRSTLVGMGTTALKKSAKALGKGLIAAVISSAAFETVSYMTGYDITKYDPFEVAFGVSAVADGTISGHITQNISEIYNPTYAAAFEMGLAKKYAATFSSRVALVAMIAEARSNGDSYVHFLDY